MNLKLLLVLLVILIFRFYFFYSDQPQFADDQKISFETTVLSQPQVIGSQQSFTANYQNNKIKMITDRFPEISYSDHLRITGRISSKGYGLLMYHPEVKALNASLNIFQSGLQKVNGFRRKIISLFFQTLPSPSSSLLLGIIFGIKEQMPKNFTDNLRISGVFHVIAASGMNVTLVAGFLSVLFAFFLKRQIAIGLSILGIIFYAILAGLEPSIIRASIMGSLVFSAQILGRQTLAFNFLSLTGFGMLFADPSLIADIGFQLSFASTLGILYLKPILERKSLINSEIQTTIAAQAATLPIILTNFGTYSLYSVLVNALVLWVVPILMIVGGIGAIVGLVIMPLGQFLICLCYPLLLYFESVVNFFGKIGGVISITNFQWQLSVGYYCLLLCFLILLKKKA